MTTVKSPIPFPRSSFTKHARRASLDNTPSIPRTIKFSLTNSLSSPRPSVRITKPSIELLTNSNSFASAFIELISRAREGLKYHDPELCEEGVNGTYFLRDKSGEMLAVFKPQDEEASCENNPKKGQESLSSLPNRGIRAGEAASREVAAHLLDHEHIYGVPKTQLVKITHKFGTSEFKSKIGSLQEFIENDGSSEDYGSRTFPVSEAHKIGILDLQILNVDRHAGNILIRRKSNSTILTPIDQGFSLLDNLECSWFEWMNWPQAKLPLSDDLKAYIARIDTESDAQMLLKELGLRSECVRTFRIMTTLLKKAVEADLTLYDIGTIVCRFDPLKPSILEQAFDKATIGIQKKSQIVDMLRRAPDAPLPSSWVCEENENALLEILFNLLAHDLVALQVAIKRRQSV